MDPNGEIIKDLHSPINGVWTKDVDIIVQVFYIYNYQGVVESIGVNNVLFFFNYILDFV